MSGQAMGTGLSVGLGVGATFLGGPMAGLAVAGAGMQVTSMLTGAAAKKAAAEQDAFLKNQQADEMLRRQAINEVLMQKQILPMKEQASEVSGNLRTTGASFGNSGVGGEMAVQKELNRNLTTLQTNLFLSRRDAEYRAAQLRAGANIDTQLASDLMTSSYIGAGSTVLTTGAGAYDKFSKYGPPSGTSSSLWSGSRYGTNGTPNI